MSRDEGSEEVRVLFPPLKDLAPVSGGVKWQ